MHRSLILLLVMTLVLMALLATACGTLAARAGTGRHVLTEAGHAAGEHVVAWRSGWTAQPETFAPRPPLVWVAGDVFGRPVFLG
jgi:hypothetical protein